MRLIDADKLKNAKFNDSSVPFKRGWNDAIETIVDNAPTVDVVEVVRCKDCKWYDNIGCALIIVDEEDRPKPDDYCSYGERKNDEKISKS